LKTLPSNFLPQNPWVPPRPRCGSDPLRVKVPGAHVGIRTWSFSFIIVTACVAGQGDEWIAPARPDPIMSLETLGRSLSDYALDGLDDSPGTLILPPVWARACSGTQGSGHTSCHLFFFPRRSRVPPPCMVSRSTPFSYPLGSQWFLSPDDPPIAGDLPPVIHIRPLGSLLTVVLPLRA